MSSATTDGIRVVVKSLYLESHSDTEEPRYVFAYRVHISNVGDSAARLLSRHWIINDARGHTEEVKGPGVIGETPRLAPGEEHSYQSFSVLQTARGTMHGSFLMTRDDGLRFEVDIPTFLLSTHSDASRLELN